MVVTLFVMCYFSFYHIFIVFLFKIERQTAWASMDNHRDLEDQSKDLFCFFIYFWDNRLKGPKLFSFYKTNPLLFFNLKNTYFGQKYSFFFLIEIIFSFKPHVNNENLKGIYIKNRLLFKLKK